MKRNGIYICLVLTLVAGAALAHSGVRNEKVMARMMLMTEVQSAMAILGKMAKGARAFDAAQAAVARDALATHASHIPDRFKAPADDPKSEALPAIWDNWSDFAAKATAMENAAQTLDTGSLATLQTGIGALGATCKSCHEHYRIKK